jgi:hypothetical protein
VLLDHSRCVAPGDGVRTKRSSSHEGGIFDLKIGPRPVRCWNLGGWVPHWQRSVPHSHVMAINSSGDVRLRVLNMPDGYIRDVVRFGRSKRSMDLPDVL